MLNGMGMVTALLGVCVVAGAQPVEEAKPADAAAPARAQLRFEDLPAPVKLGVRANTTRRRIGVIPTVVIVPDAVSYAAAIAAWSIEPREGDSKTVGVRFPVLIDDGSWRAREDIARFVRAFGPASVVRWSAPEGTAWPGGMEELKAAIERSAYGAWDAASLEEAKQKWEPLRFRPPGVVVAATADPAWTAALALAAGHGQIFAWTLAMRDLSGSMEMNEAAALNHAIAKACEASGYAWKGLGDDIDAVTLCMSTPASVRARAGDARGVFAATDVIGRGVGIDDIDNEQRWAWAGQIPGDGPRAAYSAMCSLFLQPKRAWLFDGYEHKDGFSGWDATPGATLLEKAGIGTLLNDNGNQSAMAWRNRAGGMGLPLNTDPTREPGAGIDAGLICVNTSGFAEFFDLLPGQCRGGDAPFLHTPAAVHFVHSFSAARPGDRSTIAGRFLERGAFAYVGAVHEPYLQAFVRTPAVIERMLAMGAWGASVRLDDAPTWKVAVFGDPLWTMGGAAPRVEAKLPLEGAKDIEESWRKDLREKKYAEALAAMAMQGKDERVAHLMRLIDKDDPAAVTVDVALAGIMSVFRSPGREKAAGSGERLTLLAKLSRALEPKFSEIPELRDIIWHAAYPSFTSLTEPQVTALAGAIRPEQSDRDAADLAGAAVASLGRDRAASILSPVIERLTDPAARQAVQRALRP